MAAAPARQCVLAWTSNAHTSSFEGYGGMLIFPAFIPLGALIGGLADAVGCGVIASHDREPRATGSVSSGTQ